jgi:hypothetical protein
MSLHIDSDDYDTGTLYNGVWNLYRSIIGSYQLISQRVEVQDFPWCWDENNYLQFTVQDEPFTVNVFDPADISDFQFSTDKSAIADYIETRLNGLGAFDLPHFSLLFNYDATNDNFIMTWNQTVSIDWRNSECRQWFNKPKIIETGTIFVLSAKNITISPRYLYFMIDESTTFGVTDRDLEPTLIVATQDIPLTGQKIVFVTDTSVLSISVYLPNMSTSPLPMTSGWELILNKN